MDVDDPLLMIGIAWIAILGMLAWGGVVALWRLVRGKERSPFFGMLERRGFTLLQAEDVAGLGGLAEAASRCASCDARDACQRALSGGSRFELPCPNAAFFARVGGFSV